jgi:hypothetical protein
MDNVMLSTVDNPYNPHTQFDQWYTWDRTNGYNTLSYLAHIVRSSDELSQADQDLAIEQAMTDIVNENGGLYELIAGPVVDQPT